MPHLPPPLSSVYDLSDLSDAGAEVVVAANAGQRARLAEWAGVEAVNQFEATVALRKRSPTRFSYEADLIAEVTQACVVTLEPVRSRIEKRVSRSLHLVRNATSNRKLEDYSAPPSGAGEFEEEELESPEFDLAAPLIEELVLAIDPYPRAQGVIFEPLVEKGPTESPFAVLRDLKQEK